MSETGEDADEGDRYEKTLLGPPLGYENIRSELSLAASDSWPKLDVETIEIVSVERAEDGHYRTVVSGEISEYESTHPSDLDGDASVDADCSDPNA